MMMKRASAYVLSLAAVSGFLAQDALAAQPIPMASMPPAAYARTPVGVTAPVPLPTAMPTGGQTVRVDEM